MADTGWAETFSAGAAVFRGLAAVMCEGRPVEERLPGEAASPPCPKATGLTARAVAVVVASPTASGLKKNFAVRIRPPREPKVSLTALAS